MRERRHACERAGQRGLVPRELAVADVAEPDARRAGVAFAEAYRRARGRRERSVGDPAQLDAAAVRASCRCRRSTSRSGRLYRLTLRTRTRAGRKRSPLALQDTQSGRGPRVLRRTVGSRAPAGPTRSGTRTARASTRCMCSRPRSRGSRLRRTRTRICNSMRAWTTARTLRRRQ
jgi:hypothetical protein